MNDELFHSTKNGDVTWLTETIKRRTITCNKEFCKEDYDYDGDICTFFDAVADEKDIEYYT